MSLAERLHQLLKEQKITEVELGKQVGISQQAINKIVNGETQKPRNLIAIAAALQVDPIWLLTGIGASHGASPHISPQSKSLSIPIYHSFLNNKGNIIWDSSVQIDELSIGNPLKKHQSLYGFYIPTDTMTPRFRLGELIIAHRSQPPKIGDDCIIQSHETGGDISAECHIRNLYAIHNNTLMVRQYCPLSDEEYPLSSYSAHRILRFEDLME
ncbi:MAG: helix-turn-helix domain-containing protein [Alphaproteobacteria bacterium]